MAPRVRDVHAPQGPLGLIFAPDSTQLSKVREASPLFGTVETGWTLVGIDREDVSQMDGTQVTRLLKMRSHNPQGRDLEFLVEEVIKPAPAVKEPPRVTVHSPVMDLYAVLWSIDVLIQCLLFHKPRGVGIYVAWMLIVFSALTTCAHAFHLDGRRNVLVVALALRLVDLFLRLPMSWDSEWWAIQTDAALLLRLLRGATAGRTIQLQMAMFYVAAGFWKLNTSFLDGASSCASIFGVQTAARAALMLGHTPAGVLEWEAVLGPIAQQWTPYLIIAVEFFIGIGLLLKPNVGVRVAVVFHAVNAWVPPRPNNIASFSLVCLVRLVTFAPKAAADSLHGVMRGHSLLICSLVAAFLAGAVQQAKTRDPQMLAAVAHMLLAPVVLLACRGTFPGGGRRKFAPSKTRTRFLIVAGLYCCTPLLGVLELGSPNMYANLRNRGGSNHLVAPTGLLFKTGLLGAERITVLKTTSQHILDYYPGDCTEELDPKENRQRLFDALAMRPFFNYALKQVFVSFCYTKNTWRPFEVPALELRRMLGEMRRAGKGATLTYRHNDKVVQVGYDALGNRVKCSGCGEDDVATQNPLPYALEKLLVYLPYPLLSDGNAELPCVGPKFSHTFPSAAR